MEKSRYLTAQEAAKALGISRTTLYAYVSRGLIRSEPAGERRRTRRYLAEDVDRLRERKEARRNPAQVARGALHWGTPVMDSAITLILNESLYYRGRDAIALATQATVEEVAALIWTGDPADGEALFSAPPLALSERVEVVRPHLAHLAPVEVFQTLLPLAAADDPAAYDLRPQAVARTGARILRLLTTISIAAAGDGAEGEGISQTLQKRWAPHDPQAEPLIRAALILCADHELNVSSFTARCVASAGSTPYAAVIAGLGALQGVRHGKHTGRVEGLLREAGTPDGMRAAMTNVLERGEMIPGFGHRLYPHGDPRARELLRLTFAAYPGSPVVALAQAAIEEASRLIEEQPTIDFGLVSLAWALNLPPDSAMTLFALGRVIGWIGHAIEQYETSRMIRPRARYIGEQPAAESAFALSPLSPSDPTISGV
jgi:citrate synthase